MISNSKSTVHGACRNTVINSRVSNRVVYFSEVYLPKSIRIINLNGHINIYHENVILRPCNPIIASQWETVWWRKMTSWAYSHYVASTQDRKIISYYQIWFTHSGNHKIVSQVHVIRYITHLWQVLCRTIILWAIFQMSWEWQQLCTRSLQQCII